MISGSLTRRRPDESVMSLVLEEKDVSKKEVLAGRCRTCRRSVVDETIACGRHQYWFHERAGLEGLTRKRRAPSGPPALILFSTYLLHCSRSSSGRHSLRNVIIAPTGKSDEISRRKRKAREGGTHDPWSS